MDPAHALDVEFDVLLQCFELQVDVSFYLFGIKSVGFRTLAITTTPGAEDVLVALSVYSWPGRSGAFF